MQRVGNLHPETTRDHAHAMNGSRCYWGHALTGFGENSSHTPLVFADELMRPHLSFFSRDHLTNSAITPLMHDNPLNCITRNNTPWI